MKERYVPASSMACLLLICPVKQESPGVWSGQPKVRFIITFTSFLTFVNDFLPDGDILSVSTKELRTLINLYKNGNKDAYSQLVNCFYREVAFSICKEVYMSEVLGKDATNITMDITNSKNLNSQEVESLFCQFQPSAETGLLNALKHKECILKVQTLRKQNVKLWKTAVVLYGLSENPVSTTYSFQNIN